jgi:hypothetical protein
MKETNISQLQVMKRDLSSFTLRSTKCVQDVVTLAGANMIVLFMKRKKWGKRTNVA